MNKIICQKCGGEISNEFGVTLAYCTNCGGGISLSTEQPLAFSEIPTIVSPRPKTKSKMARNLLVCLGLFLLTVIGIFGYLIWFGNPVNPDSSEIILVGVLNSKAINFVEPTYPRAARAIEANRAANVLVAVDESGNVTAAKAISGHPLLHSPAEQAALDLKFSPTLINGKAVKVTGVVIYNFVDRMLE